MRFRLAHGTEGEWPEPGQWVRSHPCGEEFARLHPEIKAFCCCPRGHGGSLVNHTIEPNGEVNASYLCHRADCGWHEMVVLEGWAP